MQLKDLRIKKGLTQEQVGKIVGVKGNTVCQYEKGKRNPKLDTLFTLSELYNVSVNDLAKLIKKELSPNLPNPSNNS